MIVYTSHSLVLFELQLRVLGPLQILRNVGYYYGGDWATNYHGWQHNVGPSLLENVDLFRCVIHIGLVIELENEIEGCTKDEGHDVERDQEAAADDSRVQGEG